ncbi:T9SS type B sorting domain-containing protein [Maribacter aestuarii]|uniref:T9SS type B sorting domain-containing protein n=1 Tax=Maribacter aestuarii TaxID=1130723 RepID=UPI00248B96DD|nr:T9SS type B sorting domain-containing protein [Maribacter aestuarii]
MLRKNNFILWLILALALNPLVGQECPTLIAPLDGQIDVPVDNPIRWTAVDGIIGYLVSLGTTPGGGEIINRRSSGLSNFYIPEVGLPESTVIYVTISLFLPDQPIKVCPLQIFTTEEVTTPPDCTKLVNPIDQDSGVRVDTDLRWEYAPRATDYIIRVGTTSGGNDIVDDSLSGNVLFYNLSELPLNQEIFVLIIPLNENGSATGCIEESFSTGEPTVSCANINFPTITIPDTVALCARDENAILESFDRARGYRWFKINNDGTETLLSESNQLTYSEIGQYRVELYNTVTEFGATIECPITKIFNVVSSEVPTIESIAITRENSGLRIEVVVSANGNYEYSLDSVDFGFQDSPIFNNVPPREHIIYVRDKNGCGIAERVLEKELSKSDFPQFFTPNGDGINDYWQFAPVSETGEVSVEDIQIYDRYGCFLVQIDPNGVGWDGQFMGRPLPSTDYWFKATSFNKKTITGHFTLKR